MRVCDPASQGSPLWDGQTHLACSQLTPATGASFARRRLHVHDRFGDLTLSIVRPQQLCVPARDPAQPGVYSLDEYACYRAHGGSAPGEVMLVDELGNRIVKALQPWSLCLPVQGAEGAVKDKKVNLACYRVSDPAPAASLRRKVTLASAPGTSTFETGDDQLLCVPATIDPCARMSFTTAAGSPSCGGKSFLPPPSPPFVGAVYDTAVGGTKTADLGAGCTYFGGGDSEYFPAAQGVTGGSLQFEATSCQATVLPLVGSPGSSSSDCTIGPSSSQKVCLNDTTRACTVDSDCNDILVHPGACAPAPRCLSGPPVPFRSSLSNACLVYVAAANASGSVDAQHGSVAVDIPTSVIVYLDAFEPFPCPRCLDNLCQGGARDGQSCTPSGNLEQTSSDCPPFDHQFYTFLKGPKVSFATAPTSKSAANGLFCPGQVNPGAFGDEDVRRIELTGTPAGNLLDFAPHPATFLNLRCIAPTGNDVVDALADFPGPQAQSIAGTVQLTR